MHWGVFLMPVLPHILEIPRTIAAGMYIPTQSITARDLSYALAVGYLAARLEPVHFDNHFRIPDNRLRGALGLSRRDKKSTENARYIRLAKAKWEFEYPLPMPTVMFRNGYPVRANLDDELTWVVDPLVREKFIGDPDDVMIQVPRTVLQKCRVRFSIELFMKMMAQHARGPDSPGTIIWEKDRIGLQLTVDEICRRFHLPKMSGSTLVQRHLEPCVKDLWEAAGVNLEIEVRRTATKRNPKGKIRDITLFLAVPEEGSIERRLRLELEERQDTPGRAWAVKPKKHYSRYKEPPAETINVTVLRPKGKKVFQRPPIGSTVVQQNGAIIEDDDEPIAF